MIVLKSCRCQDAFDGGGIVNSTITGARYLIKFNRACVDCVLDQLSYLLPIEDSITRVPAKTVKLLNRCFDAPSNEEMFQMAKNNFVYWAEEVNV